MRRVSLADLAAVLGLLMLALGLALFDWRLVLILFGTVLLMGGVWTATREH